MRTLLKRAIGATSVCALAAGMVLGANAFTKNERGKEFKAVDKVLKTEQWHFKGAALPSENNISDPLQYESGNSSTCNEIVETACNIKAPESSTNPGQPDLTSTVGSTGRTVAQRIQDAIDTQMPNETVDSFRSN
ncbi:exported hypothetical protein [Sphingobacterium sp. PM2-P1-29]|jgi:hypothetical protein|nr:exported hypothetical protein [Sphingobacterium sp. PM2-P1-29]